MMWNRFMCCCNVSMTDMVDMFYMLDRHLLITHTRVLFVCSALKGMGKKALVWINNTEQKGIQFRWNCSHLL